jgi:uncharacterized membrane protein YdbT with pleckstrin-like domain
MHIVTLKPSQWTNLGYIIFGLILVSLTGGLSLLIPAWKMLETSCIKYELYEDRLLYRRGVFTVSTNEILLFRIKSVSLHEPFLYRLVGLSNLSFITSDQYMGNITLKAIPMGPELKETIDELSKEHRRINGVREFDMYNL